jgi:hypothetical protein
MPTWEDFSNNAKLPKLKSLHRTFDAMIAVFLTLGIVLGLSGISLAQSDNLGRPNWTAYDSHAIDTINLSNLNVVINIPIMAKSGLFPISAALQKNSSVYVDGTAFASSGPEPLYVINGVFSVGQRPALSAGVSTLVTCSSGSGTTYKLSNYSVTLPDGTIHPIATTDYTDSNDCLTGSGFTNAITTDSSGYIVTASAGYDYQTRTGTASIYTSVVRHN